MVMTLMETDVRAARYGHVRLDFRAFRPACSSSAPRSSVDSPVEWLAGPRLKHLARRPGPYETLFIELLRRPVGNLLKQLGLLTWHRFLELLNFISLNLHYPPSLPQLPYDQQAFNTN